ncbi:MAG: hypothetical protein M0R17_06025 [Candidatus Omnitrophica bacterium]|jgi:hypothetical protein|nr:hypothetical protein [Candidatus Omnitrophota bacterium]
MLTAIDKLRYYQHPELTEGLIKEELVKRKLTVYGAKSSNIQLPYYLQKHTEDYDVLSKKPKKTAKEILNKFNRAYNGEYFELKKGLHRGTYKIKSIVSGKTVMDITQEKKQQKYKEHLGIRYKELPSIKKSVQRVLKRGNAKFREDKDLELLQRIELAQKTSLW